MILNQETQVTSSRGQASIRNAVELIGKALPQFAGIFVKIWQEPVITDPHHPEYFPSIMLKRGIMLMSLILTGFVISLSLVGKELMNSSTAIIFGSMVVATVLVMNCALYHLQKGNWETGRRLGMIALIGSKTYALLLTGGLANSVALPFLLLFPFYAFCFFGWKRGLFLAIAMPLIPLSLDLLFIYNGIILPDFTSDASHWTNVALTMTTAYVTMMLVMGSLAFTNQSLRQELQKERDAQKKLAQTDTLTGLLNRRGIIQALEKLTRVENGKTAAPFLLLYLDLDGFKPVNDVYGHKAGDAVLCQVARRLSRLLPNDSCLARLGGDEFALIIHGDKSCASYQDLCHQVATTVAEPMTVFGNEVQVTISIGHAHFPKESDTADSLIIMADERMLAAKRAAQNRAVNALKPAC